LDNINVSFEHIIGDYIEYCDNNIGSNLDGHAPPLHGVCKMLLLITLNIVDVAFEHIIVWHWKGTNKP
jgi:hypothetical protein